MPTELMDLEALAAWLKVSKTTAQLLAKRFPHYALGQRIKRYQREEILEYLRQERERQEQHAADVAGLHPKRLKAVS